MVGALIATHFLEDGYDSASSRTYLAIKTPEPPWNIPMLSVLLACFLWTTFLSQIGERLLIAQKEITLSFFYHI